MIDTLSHIYWYVWLFPLIILIFDFTSFFFIKNSKISWVLLFISISLILCIQGFLIPKVENNISKPYYNSQKSETTFNKLDYLISNNIIIKEDENVESKSVEFLGFNDGFYYIRLNNNEIMKTKDVIFLDSENNLNLLKLKQKRYTISKNLEIDYSHYLYPYTENKFFYFNEYKGVFTNSNEFESYVQNLNSTVKFLGVVIPLKDEKKQYYATSEKEADQLLQGVKTLKLGEYLIFN